MPSKKWITEAQAAATFSVSGGGHDFGECTGILLEEIEQNRAPRGEHRMGRRRWRILDVRGPSLRHPMEERRDQLYEIVFADGRRGSAMVTGTTMAGSGDLIG